MEIADLLYGVTMQESGVSKLVSVRLEEAEKYSEVRKSIKYYAFFIIFLASFGILNGLFKSR